MARPNSKPVKQFMTNGTYIRTFVSASAAARFVATHRNISAFHSPIVNVCNGIGNTAYGYKWAFKHDYSST